MRILWKNSAYLIALLMLLAALFPVRVWAHASLVTAIPEPNSHVTDPPSVISLTFDERLDGGLFYINVFDSKGNSVTKQEATMSVDHTMIQLELPKLTQGAYLVSYHVISADGHPVGGSYPLTIGSGSLISAEPPPTVGGDEHHHNLSSGFSVSDAGLFLSRGLYFLTLLAATGWALWQQAARRLSLGDNASKKVAQETSQKQEERKMVWRTWTENTIRLHIVALLLMIATHIQNYIGQGGLREVELLFTSTSVGLNWVVSLVLASIGLWLVGRSFWLDAGWAAALLIVKSVNGHAMTAAGEPLPVIGDFIHLFAAALWVGGMWTLLAKRRINRSGFAELLRTFSRISLISIITLAVTGTLLTILFEPNLRYLLVTEWGYVLLGKIVLVIAVVIVAGFLRLRLNREDSPRLGALLKADIALITVIVLLVGALTYLPTRPQNEPFYWHEMGDKLHVTATISPNMPGINNNFDVIVWLPIEAGDPKQVRVQLVNQDRKDLAPIEVAVQLSNKSGNDTTYGNFQKYSYHVQGTYLPFAGQWKIVVTVRNKNDDETQADKLFTVY